MSLVVIVGPPGSGKTTIGRALAESLGVPFRDADADIVAAAGKPIADIFVDDGEEHFRALEREAVRRAVAEHDGVLALGGGAVLAESTRKLLADVTVVHLRVDLAEAVRRNEIDKGRPLLAVNPRATLRRLMDERLPLYREVADIEIDTTGRDAADLAAEIRAKLAVRTVVVNDAEAPYPVLIGHGTVDRLPEFLGKAARVAVLHTASTAALAERVGSLLPDGVEATLMELPDAEDGKTVAVAEQCWEALGAEGFTRTDLVVGVGGGAVTDLAGFVAACWLRGVAVVHVPTSLLGAVDAAVGGKTGVNTAAGKNLVGAFHPPRAVLVDLDTFATLPRRDLAAGLAEVVKAGFIADPVILDLVEADPEAALDASGPVVAELVERAIAVKAEVVASDLKEGGLRAILNYGHTFAHAIEKLEHYRWRHGDAVAVGMVYAAHLNAITGRVDLVARTRSVLESLGLPTTYEPGRWDDLLKVMKIDKKNVGATQRFVLLDALAKPVVADDVTAEQQREAYERLTA
ncbi:3-dehydroquinate synthase [Glycomyces albidus]|jgi:3-dehydroquinate synthase/shikimate kinase/3-dehydroquinate synthase|uniref:Multifunctional fusion protein n=1 Tax=Glycomyces albidus TaxID=2656774 RepID=A0A6L5G8Y2_9ACTN|nr:3-dehydroquinate synthase [Glycomyces albidus]MQM26076.1 3-dehydroquinate synthase [Glycomyces albidus]